MPLRDTVPRRRRVRPSGRAIAWMARASEHQCGAGMCSAVIDLRRTSDPIQRGSARSASPSSDSDGYGKDCRGVQQIW